MESAREQTPEFAHHRREYPDDTDQPLNDRHARIIRRQQRRFQTARTWSRQLYLRAGSDGRRGMMRNNVCCCKNVCVIFICR